jgi:hypothetical protein
LQVIVSRAERCAVLVAMTLAVFSSADSDARTILFAEQFDNGDFRSRGWYAVSSSAVDSANHAPGGFASFHCHWAKGTRKCARGAPGRRKFAASSTVYVSFWIKLGSAAAPWRGSGKAYHPHLIYLLTDADHDYVGPAWCSLEFLIEPTRFTPRLAVADGRRINVKRLGANLLGTATPHAIAGGNGRQNATSGHYSNSNGTYSNATFWDSASSDFVNNKWHRVEVYVAMNSIVGGEPQADGIIKFWVDGRLVINRTDVYLRTSQFATQRFNQLFLSPYIGGGSPVAQDLWIDDLVVSDQPPSP